MRMVIELKRDASIKRFFLGRYILRKPSCLDIIKDRYQYLYRVLEKEVEAAVKKMRLPGYHFYDDSRWEGKAFLDYHVFSTPTVFLLDKEKNIVCKPYDWSELKLYIK